MPLIRSFLNKILLLIFLVSISFLFFLRVQKKPPILYFIEILHYFDLYENFIYFLSFVKNSIIMILFQFQFQFWRKSLIWFGFSFRFISFFFNGSTNATNSSLFSNFLIEFTIKFLCLHLIKMCTFYVICVQILTLFDSYCFLFSFVVKGNTNHTNSLIIRKHHISKNSYVYFFIFVSFLSS